MGKFKRGLKKVGKAVKKAGRKVKSYVAKGGKLIANAVHDGFNISQYAQFAIQANAFSGPAGWLMFPLSLSAKRINQAYWWAYKQWRVDPGLYFCSFNDNIEKEVYLETNDEYKEVIDSSGLVPVKGKNTEPVPESFLSGAGPTLNTGWTYQKQGWFETLPWDELKRNAWWDKPKQKVLPTLRIKHCGNVTDLLNSDGEVKDSILYAVMLRELEMRKSYGDEEVYIGEAKIPNRTEAVTANSMRDVELKAAKVKSAGEAEVKTGAQARVKKSGMYSECGPFYEGPILLEVEFEEYKTSTEPISSPTDGLQEKVYEIDFGNSGIGSGQNGGKVRFLSNILYNALCLQEGKELDPSDLRKNECKLKKGSKDITDHYRRWLNDELTSKFKEGFHRMRNKCGKRLTSIEYAANAAKWTYRVALGAGLLYGVGSFLRYFVAPYVFSDAVVYPRNQTTGGVGGINETQPVEPPDNGTGGGGLPTPESYSSLNDNSTTIPGNETIAGNETAASPVIPGIDGYELPFALGDLALSGGVIFAGFIARAYWKQLERTAERYLGFNYKGMSNVYASATVKPLKPAK